jgi:hypothetical protein
VIVDPIGPSSVLQLETHAPTTTESVITACLSSYNGLRRSTMDPSPSAAVLSPNSYYASLDFFSLVGLDAHSGGHTPQLEHHSSNGSGSGSASASAVTYSAHQNDFASGSPDEPLDDPSPISLDARTPSGPGRRRSAGSVTQPQSQPRSARSSIHAGHKHAAASMDFDHGAGGSSGAGAGAGSGHAANSGNNTPAIDASDLLNMDVSGAAYDAIQAGILQHQVS